MIFETASSNLIHIFAINVFCKSETEEKKQKRKQNKVRLGTGSQVLNKFALF